MCSKEHPVHSFHCLSGMRLNPSSREKVFLSFLFLLNRSSEIMESHQKSQICVLSFDFSLLTIGECRYALIVMQKYLL